MNNDYTFECKFGKIEAIINSSKHAINRIKKRGMNFFAICGSIIAAGDYILDMKDSDEFAVIDKELHCTTIAGLHVGKESGDLYIDIITILDNDMIHIKNGTKIIKLDA